MPLNLGFLILGFRIVLLGGTAELQPCQMAETPSYLIKLDTRFVSFDTWMRILWASLRSYIFPFVVNMYLSGMQDSVTVIPYIQPQLEPITAFHVNLTRVDRDFLITVSFYMY